MRQAEQIPGQMSIFDFLDMPSLKTSPEPCQATKETISEWFCKKCVGSKMKMPMFLDLRGGRNGQQAESSWEMGIPWHGESTIFNTLDVRKGDEDYAYVLISMEIPHQEWYMNMSEKPLIPKPSKLSEILETDPKKTERYRLSARACQGILNRARKRGKKLPEMLERALLQQSASKNEAENPGGGKGILIQDEHTGALSTLNNQSVCYGISPLSSNSMKSSNPHSGVYKADTARTLDLNGGNPSCNQGGMAVVQNIISKTVCIGNGQLHDALTPSEEVSKCLNCLVDPKKVVISYGQEAQNDMYVVETFSQDAYDKYESSEKSPSVKASGGNYGGGQRSYSDTVGALCARDFKGVGNQYVDEGKLIVEEVKETKVGK